MKKKVIVALVMVLPVFLFAIGCRTCDKNVMVDDKQVIIIVDEGLVDQLGYYLVGERIKSLGYKVKYDTLWYKSVGSASRSAKMSTRLKKFFRVFPSVNSRTFQLKQAFPYLDFDIASEKEVKLYKKRFTFSPKKDELWGFGPNSAHPPVYIPIKIGKWRLCKDMFEYMLMDTKKEIVQKIVNRYFHFEDSILDTKNLEILARIRSAKCPVGVHVRCGDDFVKGKSSSAQYFVRAVNKVKEMFPDASFFFVSDEPDYVKNELLPKFDKSIKIEIIDINNVDMCYKDLFLISECKHQVRSYGSMGAVAYLLNKWPDKKLIAPNTVREYKNITPDFVIEE